MHTGLFTPAMQGTEFHLRGYLCVHSCLLGTLYFLLAVLNTLVYCYVSYVRIFNVP
jgi:hypothetical protein